MPCREPDLALGIGFTTRRGLRGVLERCPIREIRALEDIEGHDDGG